MPNASSVMMSRMLPGSSGKTVAWGQAAAASGTMTGDLIEFDLATGSVVVIMTTLREVPGGQAIPVEAYRWTLDANFSTHIKDLTKAGNVFPGTSLDRRDACRGLQLQGLREGRRTDCDGPSREKHVA